jgi:hypothetical protein
MRSPTSSRALAAILPILLAACGGGTPAGLPDTSPGDPGTDPGLPDLAKPDPGPETFADLAVEIREEVELPPADVLD